VQATSNQGWAASYTHDRNENLTNKAGQSIGVDRTTNRLIGVGFDNNGNFNGTTWQYDIEDRLTKWTSNSSPDQDYGYDSGNKRVWKRHVRCSQEWNARPRVSRQCGGIWWGLRLSDGQKCGGRECELLCRDTVRR
jgi:hypothetical protein